MVQGTSRGAEKGRRKTNQNRRSQRLEGGENTKEKKSKRSRKVFSVMKEIYSRK